MKILDLFRSYPELKTAIINLKNGGPSFKAVVWRKTGPFLVLKNAQLLEPNGPRPLDGEVVIQLVDVEFIQVT